MAIACVLALAACDRGESDQTGDVDGQALDGGYPAYPDWTATPGDSESLETATAEAAMTATAVATSGTGTITPEMNGTATTTPDVTSTVLPATEETPSGASNRVGVCHRTGSANNPYVYIEVAPAAVAAHEAHGDTVDVGGPEDCASLTPEP